MGGGRGPLFRTGLALLDGLSPGLAWGLAHMRPRVTHQGVVDDTLPQAAFAGDLDRGNRARPIAPPVFSDERFGQTSIGMSNVRSQRQT